MSPTNKSFRAAETKQLMALAQAGDSASIVGVSGIGKSNLFNHLLLPETQRAALGEAADHTIFVRTNFHFVADFTTRSIYSLILDQIELLPQLSVREQSEIVALHNALIDAGEDVLKVQRHFKLALRVLMTPPERKLIFLFDQFEEVFESAAPRLLANLRGLREDYKYRLCYFVFTRHPLSAAQDEEEERAAAREEFVELLGSRVIGLRPYTPADAADMLGRIGERYGWRPGVDLIERLYELTSGHGGLLRAAYLAVMHGEVVLDDPTLADGLLALTHVQAEAIKIWQSLTAAEKRFLAYKAHGLDTTITDSDIVSLLQLKGVLTKEGEIFAPLFGRYIVDHQAVWERALDFDAQTKRVIVYGKPIELTQTELHIFTILFGRIDEPVSSREIMNAVWPNLDADQTLKSNIYRLRRKIELDSRNPQFLTSVHSYGYQLNQL